MKSKSKRLQDVRIIVKQTVFAEFAERFHIKKGSIIDGRIDKDGNFRSKNITIYPSHFKILGKFYFRKTN